MKAQQFSCISTRRIAAFAAMALLASAVFAATKENSLYRFKGGTDGANPAAGLFADQAGNLYGTTVSGGASNLGTVFEVSPPGTAWSETVLYTFAGGTDGANPYGNLIMDKAGNLYGTTFAGGGSTNCTGTPAGCGTVFQLAPPAVQGDPWTETVLYSFNGKSDGANPAAGLIMDSTGNLYGTTVNGGVTCGAGTCGTVFELTPPAAHGDPWTETVLHRFGIGSDGIHPASNLVFGLRGALFGTTASGNKKAQFGVVFKLKPPATQGGSWTEGVPYRFLGGSDGANPSAGLIVDKTGNVYGTTYGGGSQSSGVVFEVSFSGGVWTESVLYSFTGGADGSHSAAGLLADKAGNLYGTTTTGGQNNNGSAFELTPGTPWTETTLHDFVGGYDGSEPTAAMTFGKGGQLYGTTLLGGHPGKGTVFRIIH